ncbi:hypothetical protein F4779DRAFT_641439 [Xylariaceae sp. FL0662B]|nr:hypothetical protein F4779DRAFT_641439 [Xylariaceae sp. FL0662B]
MSVGLLTLPPDIIALILSHLDGNDIRRLAQCSRAHHELLKPLLDGSYLTVDGFMKQGCVSDNVLMIQFALLAGASPSVVETPRQGDRSWDRRKRSWITTTKPIKIYTLHLAAKTGSINAFQFLLARGARVDDPDMSRKQMRHLLNRLCKPDRVDFLQMFCEAGLVAQVQYCFTGEFSTALVTAIKPGASIYTVEILLDHGADPDYVRRGGGLPTRSPLSAAVMTMSTDIFKLLAERGANVQGTHFRRRLTNTADHIPMMAAARMIPTHGTEMAELCIGHGAYVNCCTTVRVGTRSSIVTPLLMYLCSITDWTGKGACKPSKGLDFLFHKRISARHMVTIARPWHHLMGPPVIQCLLDIWGLRYLCETEYFRTLVILVVRGGAPLNLAQVLMQYRPYAMNPSFMMTERMLRRWVMFLRLFRGFYYERGLAHQYLCQALTAAGTTWRRGEPLMAATLDHLLQAGADINWSPEGPGGHSPLLELCRIYNNVARQSTRGRDDITAWFRCGWPKDQVIRFLLDKGANPKLKVGDTITAVQILTRGFRFEMTTEAKGAILPLASLLYRAQAGIDVTQDLQE